MMNRISPRIRNRWLLCLLLLSACIQAHAQQLTEQQTKHLYLLGQTWSLAKNYHSETCRTDWDSALLDAIPLVLAQSDAAGFNEQLAALLGRLGQNQTGTAPVPLTPDWIRQPRDLGWLESPELSDANRSQLREILETFRPRINCHVNFGDVGQPSFLTDDGFFETATPDANLRLLGLMRFWNMIDSYFPYKNLIGRPWAEVLLEYIPRLHAAEGTTAYQKAMRQLTAEIQDSHGAFFSPYFNSLRNRSYLPFVLKTVEGKLVIYEHRDTALLGAEVLTINERPVAELVEEAAALTAASNPSTLTRNIDGMLNQGIGGARLEVRTPAGERLTVQSSYQLSALADFRDRADAFYDLDQDVCTIGYVNMGQLTTDQVQPMFSAFENKDAIVFDLRNYPNGTLWTMVDYLFNQPLLVARFAYPNLDFPGGFEVVDAPIGSNNGNEVYRGRVIILINEETQSQAEYTTMGLEQHPLAVKIGSQTAAADGNISEVRLPGGITTFFTSLGVYYPDNRGTQRVGIVPDLFVRPTIDGVAAGRDEVLEAALHCDDIQNEDWPAAPEPEVGLYWDPAKDGKGLDIHAVNGNHAVYAYDFRDDGSPVWYLGYSLTESGQVTIEEGELFEFDFDYDTSAAVAAGQPFELSMDYKQGVFEIACAVSAPELKRSPSQMLWRAGEAEERRCLEKLIFSEPAAAENFTGLWYGGPGEDGWGFSINHQGNVVAVIVYFYDEEGRASWIIGSGALEVGRPTTMEMSRVTGFCVSCEAEPVRYDYAGTVTVALDTPTGTLSEDNWISLNLEENTAWNRERMPIVMITGPLQE